MKMINKLEKIIIQKNKNIFVNKELFLSVNQYLIKK